MVFYGWYRDEFLNERPKNLICLNCNTKSNSRIMGEASIFHIFYIPLFPYKVSYKVECLSCNEITSLNHYKEHENLRKPRLKQIWYFSGILFIMVMMGWDFYKGIEDRVVFKERLENIEINRIIQIQDEDLKFTSLKITKVHDERVSVVYNKFKTEDRISLEKVLKSKNYSNDTTSIERAILLRWFNEEKIINVHW